MEQIRQGDILLKRIDRIEDNIIVNEQLKLSTGKRVLAYGEKTGHTHVLDGDVSYFDNGNGQLLCRVDGKAELVHQEHKSIQIPTGDYLIIRQRESDIVEGIRQVSD